MFIFRTLFFFIHLVLLILLLATGLNAYWPPKWGAWLNLLSLAFPFLCIAYILCCFYWIFDFRKRGILFVIGLIFLFPFMQRWVNYSSNPKGKKADIRVMSYNTKGISSEKTDFLNAQNADILILQESGWINDKMRLSQFKHQAHSEVVSIYSKFPIIKQEKIRLSKSGYAQYADIKMDNKIIRVFNIYLQPYKLSKSMVKPSDDAIENDLKAQFLLSRLTATYTVHQEQLEEILPHIKNSPYPIILGGDFNAVPNSYEYYQIHHWLKDAFVEAGIGSATSFHDYAIPIRIDYIFTSEELTTLKYEVKREINLSDHYPVYAEFLIK